LSKSASKQSALFKISVALIVALAIIILVVFFLVRRKRVPDKMSQGKYYPVAYLFIAPALGVLAIFLFIPIIATFILSLTNWNIYAVNDMSRVLFIGFEN